MTFSVTNTGLASYTELIRNTQKNIKALDAIQARFSAYETMRKVSETCRVAAIVGNVVSASTHFFSTTYHGFSAIGCVTEAPESRSECIQDNTTLSLVELGLSTAYIVAAAASHMVLKGLSLYALNSRNSCGNEYQQQLDVFAQDFVRQFSKIVEENKMQLRSEDKVQLAKAILAAAMNNNEPLVEDNAVLKAVLQKLTKN